MPIYEYRCKKGHTFDVLQKMSDDPLETCTTCGAPVQQVFHPIAVHFKGKGFYNTDYGTKRRNREQAAEKSGSEGGGDKAAADKTDGKSADKPAEKTASKKADAPAKPAAKPNAA